MAAMLQHGQKVDEQWLPEIAEVEGKTDHRRLGAGRQFRHLVREATAMSGRTQRPVANCFREIWRGLLGLRDYRCRESRTGYKTKFEADKQKIHYEDLPLREISEELFSTEFVDGLGNEKIGQANAMKLRENMPTPAANAGQWSLRESLAPVTASTMQDISLFSVYIGGLFEAKFLEGYQSPEFIGRSLVKSEPTNAREQRIFTTARVPAPSKAIIEGQEYPNVGVLPRWIIRPPVIKRGQKASVTREAIAYGIGGQLLEQLQGGGFALGYLEEYLIAAYIQGVNIPVGQQWFQDGVAVNSYLYNQEPGSALQPTYQATAGTGTLAGYNYANLETGSSGLQTYLQLQEARQQLSLATEPETGFRIKAELDMVKVAMGAVDNAFIVKHATSVVPVSPGFATSGTPAMTFSMNPAGNAKIDVVASAIWDQQLLDAGISAANLLDYWYAGNFRKSFGWASVWDTGIIPMDVRSASMVSSDTVWGAVFSWLGTPYVLDPRFNRKYTN